MDIAFEELLRRMTQTTEPLSRGFRVLVADHNIFQLTALLSHERCPQGLTIHRNGLPVSHAFISMVATILRIGRCPEWLSIDLSHHTAGLFYNDISILMSALGEGQHPRGLSLNLENNELGYSDAEDIASALATGRCAQDLSINLRNNPRIGNTSSVSKIADALSTGQCPEGLSLDLSNCQISKINALIILESLSSPQIHHPFRSIITGHYEVDETIRTHINAQNYARMPPIATEAVQPLYDAHGICARETMVAEVLDLCTLRHAQRMDYATIPLRESETQGRNATQSAQFLGRHLLKKEFEAGKELIGHVQFLNHEMTDRRRLLEHQRTRTNCPICLEEYPVGTGNERRALLPCLHLFCVSCLEILHANAAREGRTVICPECRGIVSGSAAVV